MAVASLRITSFSDVVALLGLLGGCLYFYNRAYSAVFLSSFGLGVGVVPMSMQDAMVDGLEGMTINILYLWVPIATAFLLHFLWIVGSRFFEVEQHTATLSREQAPTTWWAKRRARVRADLGVSRVFDVLVSVIAAPAVLLLAVFFIAVPAELSARRDVTALRALVAVCDKCARYEVAGQKVLGRAVASTADRLFVLRPDGHVMPMRIDDVRSVEPVESR